MADDGYRRALKDYSANRQWMDLHRSDEVKPSTNSSEATATIAVRHAACGSATTPWKEEVKKAFAWFLAATISHCRS